MVAGIRRPVASSVAVALGDGEGPTDGPADGEPAAAEVLGDAAVADSEGAAASPPDVHPARSRARAGISSRGRRTAASLRVPIDGTGYQPRSSASSLGSVIGSKGLCSTPDTGRERRRSMSAATIPAVRNTTGRS